MVIGKTPPPSAPGPSLRQPAGEGAVTKPDAKASEPADTPRRSSAQNTALAFRSLFSAARLGAMQGDKLEAAVADPNAGTVVDAAKTGAIVGVLSSVAVAQVGAAMGHQGAPLTRVGVTGANGLSVVATIVSLPDSLRALSNLATSSAEFARTSAKTWAAQFTGSPTAIAQAHQQSAGAESNLLKDLRGSALVSAFLIGDAALSANVLLTARATYETLAKAVPDMSKSERLKKAIQVGLLNSNAEALVRQVAGCEAGRAVAAVAKGPWGKIATFAFRLAGPVYAVIDALNVAQAWNEEPRDLGKVALRSVALAGTLVCAAVAFAPAAVIAASTAAFVGAGGAAVWGAARLAEHFYEKSKEAPTQPTVPVQVSAA